MHGEEGRNGELVRERDSERERKRVSERERKIES